MPMRSVSLPDVFWQYNSVRHHTVCPHGNVPDAQSLPAMYLNAVHRVVARVLWAPHGAMASSQTSP
jgi:hypothetical protein